MDISGYLYVLGRTESTDLPVTSGTYQDGLSGNNDLFILKLDPSGTSIIAGTYFGGSNGNEYQRCGITLGIDGNVIIGGDTRSNDLPTTTGAHDTEYNGAGDMYVACFNPGLDDLVFSTYLGAHETEYFGAITVADDGSIYVTGGTESTDYPVSDDAWDQEKGESTASYEDVVISRLDQSGSTLLNSTFLGDDGDERGTSIQLSGEGDVYIGGWTAAPDFPTTDDALYGTHSGGTDCHVSILNRHLTDLKYATFFGGSDDEGGNDVNIRMKVSDSGSIYIAGHTESTDLPTDGSSYQQDINGGSDSFAAAFQRDALSHCTYLGGSDGEFILAMDLDHQDNVIISGMTKSSDHPLTPDAQYDTYMGGGFLGDGIISILSPDLGSLYYSTYYGGTGDEIIYDVLSTQDGSLYFCGVSTSSDIPLTHNFSAPQNGNGNLMLLVSGGFSSRDPLEIYSLEIFSDPEYSRTTSIRDKGERVYIEITGLDANASTRDGTRVNLTFSKGGHLNLSVWLRETDLNTGIYRGWFRVPLSVNFFENITLYADKDPSKTRTFIVDTPVRLNRIPAKIVMQEHENLSLEFENLGWFEDPVWNYTTNSHWIDFDNGTRSISETPLNPDVGNWKIRVNITDGAGNRSEVESTITVVNIPPDIIGEDILEASQGEEYLMDYDTDEDDEGGMVWVHVTDVEWIEINRTTGVLSGTPEQEDVGSFRIGVIASDGNGGSDERYFNITVLDVNDPPRIVTSDIYQVNQGDPFQRKYEVEDIDPGDSHTWSLVTDAEWLSMNNDTGLLSGTPGPLDIGTFTINITVTDSGNASDSREFDMTVNNINDRPFFVDVPPDYEIISGRTFTFQVNASDYDPDTKLRYSVSSTPRTDISIDPDTGLLEWKAKLDIFKSEPYRLYVELIVSDGEMEENYEFEILVEKTQPPTSTLISPENGKRISFRKPMIKWAGTDPEGEPLTYDVYIGESQAYVQSRKEETLYISDYSGTSMEVSGLEVGKTYYWLVIPFDGGSHGACSSNIFSFELNSPPEIEEIELQEASVGKQFRLLVKAQDLDHGVSTDQMRYYLDESPDGMTIGELTGMIIWTPSEDQKETLFNVVVNVSDGTDYTRQTFIIQVQEEKDEEGLNISLFIVIGLLVLLLAVGVVLFIFIRKRRDTEEETEEPEEEISEEVADSGQPLSDVPLSTAEAHAHLGKGSKAVSYQDLYGAAAPEEDAEEMSTTELRDYIHDKISELENGKDGNEE